MSIPDRSCASKQELRGTPWLKRMPCLIIGRHAQLPREVLVVCKQNTGTLLLGNAREELKVRLNLVGNQVVSPSEFEAAAGCSKGKNWKVCEAAMTSINNDIGLTWIKVSPKQLRQLS